MDKLKGEFADGAEKKGFDKAKAEELFDLIVKFAGYGFNKSHSAAYAMVTFYTSYLKCYYPTDFMAAQLTLEKDNTTKVVKYVEEVKRMGIELLPPDINKSGLKFIAANQEDKEVILFGLGAIKGAGDIAIATILEARGDEPFSDLSDFVSRIDSSKVNKKVIESLIKSGALDSFGYSRRAMIMQIEDIIEAAQKSAQAKKQAVGSLFGGGDEMTSVDIELNNVEEFEPLEILAFEKETLGFYVSGHPLDEYREKLESINYTLSSDLDELSDGSEAILVGRIEEIKEKISKKGNKFGIATLLDLHGNIELMLFEKHIKLLEEQFNINEPIAFKVKISKNDDFTRLSIMKIESLDKAAKEKVKIKREESYTPEPDLPPIIIAINLMPDSRIAEELMCLAQRYPGRHPLSLKVRSKLADVVIESKMKVSQEFIKDAVNLGFDVEEAV